MSAGPSRSVRPLLASLLLWSAVASCGRKPEDVIGEHRAAAEAQLGRFEAIGRLVKEAAPLESNAMELSGPPPNFPPFLGKHDAVAMAPEHFDDPAAQREKYRLVPHNPIADAASLLRKGTLADGSSPNPGDSTKIEEVLREFLALRYALVLRTTGGREPQVQGDQFVGGLWEGEAVLYDLQAGARAGGFRFVAENAQKVEVDPNQAAAWLLGDLREKALLAVRAEFQSRFPQGNAPFGDEVTDPLR
jgi:hypothetical protein